MTKLLNVLRRLQGTDQPNVLRLLPGSRNQAMRALLAKTEGK